MGEGKKASRPKGSVAATRERQHVNIVSRVHGRVRDAGSSKGLDSNTQDQVIQMMSQGMPEKTGAVHKDKISSYKAENLSQQSFVCSMQSLTH